MLRLARLCITYYYMLHYRRETGAESPIYSCDKTCRINCLFDSHGQKETRLRFYAKVKYTQKILYQMT